jgi:hypothetical protein
MVNKNNILYSISNWGYEISSKKMVFLSTIIIVLFGIFVLPKASDSAKAYSEGVGSIDIGFGNTGADLIEIVEQYGVEGRESYLKSRWTFDLVFPMVFTFFGFTVNSFLLKKLAWDAGKYFWVNILIVVGMAFDYLENIFASFLILTIENPSLIIANLLSIFSVLKWMFVLGGFATIFIFLLLLAIRYSKNSRLLGW